MEGRSRRNSEPDLVRGEPLDFFSLLDRLPPDARPFLLMEEKARLEGQLKRITELLEGTEV